MLFSRERMHTLAAGTLLSSALLFTPACERPQTLGQLPAAEPQPPGGLASSDLVRPLPPQYRAGLRVEATLRTSRAPWGRGHALDLRLTNLEDDAKRRVTVEKVTLGHALTEFRRPPVVTLWRRGSTIDYPAVATWPVREPPVRVMRPLVVVVHYDGRHGGVVAPFQWDVWLEGAE
jgi:hypothetical protein